MSKSFRGSSATPATLLAFSWIVAGMRGTKSSGISFLSGGKERRPEVIAAEICGAEYGRNGS